MLRLLKTTRLTNQTQKPIKRGFLANLSRFFLQCLAIFIGAAICYGAAVFMFGATATFNTVATFNLSIKPFIIGIHLLLIILLFVYWQSTINWLAKKYHIKDTALPGMYAHRNRICLMLFIAQIVFVYRPWQWL